MKKKLVFLFFSICVLGLAGFWRSSGNTKAQYAKIPITFSSSCRIPLIEAEVASRKCQCELDLGSDGYLALHKDVLERIQNKTEDGQRVLYDCVGNEYVVPRFILSELKIANFKTRPIPTDQESVDFLRNTIVGAMDEKAFQQEILSVQGRLGVGVFERVSFLIDLPHSLLYVTNNTEVLIKEGIISLNNALEIPLLSREGGVFFPLDTEEGLKKFLLDTGSEYSMLQDAMDSKEYIKSSLAFGGTDLGSYVFYKRKISDLLEVDGILGIEFLEKHAVVIDMPNQKMYLFP